MSERQSPDVVVLDDSPALARAFGAVLADACYRVTTISECAGDPAHQIGLDPDPILLDYQSGHGWHGFDVLRRPQADPAAQDVPVFASPTIAWFDNRTFAATMGALRAEVLAEPFSVDGLLSTAHAAVAWARGVRTRADSALDDLHTVKKKHPSI